MALSRFYFARDWRFGRSKALRILSLCDCVNGDARNEYIYTHNIYCNLSNMKTATVQQERRKQQTYTLFALNLCANGTNKCCIHTRVLLYMANIHTYKFIYSSNRWHVYRSDHVLILCVQCVYQTFWWIHLH